MALVLSGVAFGLSWPAFQSMIASVVPSELRQRYFGVNFTLLNLGIGIGGIIGGLFVDVDRLGDLPGDLPRRRRQLPARRCCCCSVPLRHVAGPGGARPRPTTRRPVGYLAVLRSPAMAR